MQTKLAGARPYLVTTVVAVVFLTVGAAPAGADKCNGAKVKAIGKKEAGLLGCSAKEATKSGVEPTCDTKVSGKFTKAYDKPTGCSPAAPADTTCETAADTDCQTAIRAVLPDGTGTTPSKCEASRLKAAGKLASAELGCIAKAATKGLPVDSGCMLKATGKFTVAFNKVSGCTGDRNASAIQADVENDCVNNMMDVSGGNFGAITCGAVATTTTTTSTSTSSATMASTTTNSTTTTTSTTMPGAVCGNGIREPGEQCDDGNTTNLDGCDSTCQFEQNQRLTSLALSGTTSTACPNNALGVLAFTGIALGNLNTTLTTDINNGTISILFRMLGLQDLTGTTAAAIQVGVLDGSPTPPTAYPGNNPIDWWFTADPSAIDANRIPIDLLPGSIAAHVLTAGPAPASLPLIIAGSPAPLAMWNLALTSTIDTNPPPSMPSTSTGSPPGHLASENLDPSLVSYQTSSSGTACGDIRASSLQATPIPAAFVSGATACGACAGSHVYTATNSLLDLLVGGCKAVSCFVTLVNPTQPDAGDPAAPVGTGPPYALFLGAGNTVTSCSGTTDLGGCLNAAGYSANFTFSSNRAIIK